MITHPPSEASIESFALWAALGGLAALLFWETLHPFFPYFRSQGRRRLRHGGKNLLLGIGNSLIISVVFAGAWFWASDWSTRHDFGLIPQLSSPFWIEAGISILILDFWTYWWHRMNHRIPFLWRFHRMHHSDPEMDVTTASRFHFGEIILSSLLRIIILLLLGAPLWHLALYEAILFPVVQFHHANIALPSWLERLARIFIVTPSMHKVHHSRFQPETNSNYTSLFSIWDRLFGSFQMRSNFREIQLGLDGFDGSDRQSLKGLALTPLDSSREKEA